MGARARERVLDEHTYAHRACSCSHLAASARFRQARVLDRRIAIVPARDEEDAVAGVVEELRASIPRSTSS